MTVAPPEKPKMTAETLAALCRQWTPQSLATFYEWCFAELGYKMPKHIWPVCLGLCDNRINKLMLIVGPGAGKALHPDTKVLLTHGWVAMKDVKVGDYVITPDGVTPALVRAVLPQPPSRLYRLTFNDGRQILANKDHLWTCHNKKFNHNGGSLTWRIRNTEELYSYLRDCRGRDIYVPLCKPVEFPKQQYEITPYILGAILGDGNVSATGYSGMTCFDPEIMERIEREGKTCGIEVSTLAKEGRFGLRGSGPAITDLGLRDSRSWTKFIPPEYKTGSIKQRYALIQGMMDTDGYVDEKGSLSYCTTSKQLALDVQEVLWSLGAIVNISEKRPFCTYKGNRVEGKLAYVVNIRHSDPQQIFHLTRKKERAQPTQYADNLKLRIEKIELVEESESICINIGHPDGLFLVENYVVTHNSLLLSTIYPTWLLGHDPCMTILGVSGGESLMQGFQQSAMDLVANSPAFKLTFPNVKPDKELGWSMERGMFVTGRKPGIPDASYLAAGLQSKFLVGKHGKLMIIDDIHNADNSATAEACDAVVSKYYNTILGRADPMGARFILAGRRWRETDIYGVLKGSEEWVVMELPAERAGKKGLYFDIYVPDGMDCVFTDRHVHCADGTIVKI